MQWFQMKEKSAGQKRLMLTYFIYKLSGDKTVYVISFIVAFVTFLFSKDLRFYSKQYFDIISKYTKIKPSLYNQFKQIFSYACSLVDRMIIYTGNFKTENIMFENEKDKRQLFDDIAKKQGICFIFGHVGNIEVLHAFFKNQKEFTNPGVNIFLNKKQTKIFNDFIDKIKNPFPVKYITTENFDISEMLQLKENLEKGEVLFIAGDRLSENNTEKVLVKTMFSHKINLPQGSFRLAKLLKIPIYFICAVKQKNNKYQIHLKKHLQGEITDNYIEFFEKIIIKNPYQFYHFYDFFNK